MASRISSFCESLTLTLSPSASSWEEGGSEIWPRRTAPGSFSRSNLQPDQPSSKHPRSSSSPPPAVLGDRALISVIVPCRNEAAAIRLTLCRIVDAAADPSCLEIVVVDGGSRDGTVAMAQSLRGEMLRRVRSFQVLPSTGFGRGATLNTGAAASRGVAAFLGASGKETATATRGEGERGGDEKNGNHGEGTADTGNTGRPWPKEVPVHHVS